MQATKQQSDWISRVLGIAMSAATPQEAMRATVTAMIGKAEKAAGVARPNSPPRRPRTERLLGAMTARPTPADPMDMPAHVEAFVPDFLVSIEAERPADSGKLETGSAVPGPDQLLGMADVFAATQSALREWERVLDQAETAESLIDVIEEQEESRDETEYAGALMSYNSSRKQAIAAEATAINLLAELRAAFNGLSEAAQAQASKEAGDNA